MKVAINNKKYEARYSLKAQMLWEKCYDRAFGPNNLYEIWCYYYFILVVCNDGFEDEMTLEDLLKYASEDASIGEAMFSIAAGDSKKKVVTRLVPRWLLRMFSRS